MVPVTDVDDEVEVAGGLRLEIPEEPEKLRIGLRDELLAGGDWRKGFPDDLCIGTWLWTQWEGALEPAGCSKDRFVEILIGTRRELWLWLLGYRRWEQYVAGLAGRVVRRLPAAP